MRNLVSLRRQQWPLPSGDDARQCSAYAAFALHTGEAQAFFLRGDGRIDAATLDADDTALRAPAALFVDLQASIPLPTSDDAALQWKWISYVAEIDALACAHANGTLAVVDIATQSVEEIGAMDGGICGVAWSSDQEMVAIVTGVGTVLVMNAQWEVLHETQLDAYLPSDVARQQSEHVPADVALHWRDDAQYLVLNVPVVSAGTGQAMQKVMVFTAQLAFHALGRLEDGRATPHLGATVTWSPNQSLIASTETRKEQLFVVFFERNGLRHGEFALPARLRASEHRVTQLGWSIDSDVLAVALESADRASSLLQLWTRDNYHWYLKHERRFDDAEAKHVVRFAWDAERAHQLHVLTRNSSNSSATLLQEEFTWDVSRADRSVQRAATAPSSSVVVTGVIDGATLLLTPLHQALVPPPLALHQLTFAAPINSVVFDAETEALAVLLATGDVVVVEQYMSPTAAITTRVQLARDSSDDDDAEPLSRSLTSLEWMRLAHSSGDSPSLTLVAKAGWDDALVVGSTSSLLTSTLSVQYPPALDSVRRVAHVVDQQRALSTATDSTPLRLAIQTHDGSVHTLDPTSATSDATELTDRCPAFTHFTVLAVAATDSRSGGDAAQLLVVGRERTGKLYVDDKLVAPATSTFTYCPRASVLLFTTLGSAAELRMLPLDALVHHRVDVYEARAIERGAKLVAVVSDRAHVVVQLPRGNLECMAPRLLVLALVVQLIEQRAYVAALEMGRKHRLDLNVLVDFDVDAFLASAPAHLVRAYIASKPAAVTSDRLCLFLTSLHAVDVWRTKYAPQVTPFLAPGAAACGDDAAADDAAADRVNVVCRAIMAAICDVEAEERDRGSDERGAATALLLPYVTAAVKQSPPQYADALAKVQSLLATRHGAADAKRALKHLIVLTHVDVLMDEALGLYDVDLVRFVATYSQRDPKEYVPFLDELARIAATDGSSATLLKFRVDLHLKRYERALTHVCALVQSASDATTARTYEDAAVDVVTRSGLYDKALAHLRASSQATPAAKAFRSRVVLLKAAHLEATNEHEAAAYVYLSEAAVAQAQRAFLAAGLWQLGLSLALKTTQAPSEVQQLAYSVAQTLLQQQADSSRHGSDRERAAAATTARDVARIYVEYCNDIDEAVAVLVSSQQYDEALRLAYLHKRADLVESDVEPGVLDATKTVLDDIAANAATYARHWTRLTALQEQKRLFKLHGIDGSRWQQLDGDNDDAQSVVSGAPSAADSALSSASMRSVGSHNSAVSIGNFALQSLAHATSSHFYASAAAGASAAKAPKKVRLSRNERRNKIKKGSVEEELFVWQQCVASEPSAAMRVHVKALLQMLVLFGHVQQAQTLQSALSAFETLVRVDKPLPAQPHVAANAKAPGADGEPSGSDSTSSAATAPLVDAWRLAALRDE